MHIKYIGQLDNHGISNRLNIKSNGDRFESNLEQNGLMLQLAMEYLPERQKVHHTHYEWLKDNVIDVLAETEISISFITEGAGYRNSLGYFIYETKDPPKNLADIKTAYIAFANFSAKNSGGNLILGDTMQLPFIVDGDDNESNYSFPAGYSVGFLLFPDGWNGSEIKRNCRPFCSISKLNPETSHELKYHTVCLLPDGYNKLIVGFEDIDREKSSCDHDFNDCVFSINTNILSISKTYTLPDKSDDGAPSDNYIIVYKKILSTVNGKTVECVATLYIPSSSKILKKFANANRFRTNNAYIKSIIVVPPRSTIFNGDYTGYSLTEGYSLYKSSFIYKVGTYVSQDIDENTLSGIYFHYTFDNAADYMF